MLDRHFEHLGDVRAFPLDLERFPVVALAPAGLARHIDVGQKVHFDSNHAVAFAGFATTVFHIEGESTRAIATLARQVGLREKFPDRCEEAGVGGGVRARCAPNRALIDRDDFVKEVQPLDRIVRRWFGRAAVKMA